ncbi:MAG: hypothetical protein HY063_02730 [Bacteroidetes bacterium]|nr:hypothetical protein [Bacteroidota bacterium]
MKKQFTFFLFFSFPVFCLAQHWNEWINYGQQYYKIPVAQNGIYRLDYATLSPVINVSNIDLHKFQIFFRGQEQYIYVKDNGNNDTFDINDYIEFYGRKNDGSLDSVLYKGDLYNLKVRQPNPYYSLFNDTSMYFLTWNNSTTNKRITDSSDTNFSFYPASNYFMKEIINEYHSYYYTGKRGSNDVTYPKYDEVEGWAADKFGYGNNPPPGFSSSFNTSNIYPGQNVLLKLAVMGVNNEANFPDHHLQIKYKNNLSQYILIADTAFDGYQLYDSSFSIPSSQFGASTDIKIDALPIVNTTYQAVPYVVLKYPHTANLGNASYYEMFVPYSTQAKSNFTFTSFNNLSSSVYLYDFTDNLRIPATVVSGSYEFLIPSPAISSDEKFCVLTSDNSSNYKIPSIKPVNSSGYFTNYFSQAADSAFIIVTNKSLMGSGSTGAVGYKSYRASAQGGSRNVVLADMEELYDQFAYGIPKHPFAIRHFAKYCADTFPSVPHELFLIGKSIENYKCRNQYNPPDWGNYLSNYANCLVPTIAYPASDNMLVSSLNGNLIKPLIPTGRLAARSIADVDTYRTKVNEYEHAPREEWFKEVIHMSGGADAGQQLTFCNELKNDYKPIIENIYFGGHVHGFCKNSSSPTQTSNSDSIRGLINNGVSLVTYFGHSSSSILEFNLLPPEDYDNHQGKYPFFSATGCYAGNIHLAPSEGASLSEQYVINPKGMIAFLASSGPATPQDSHTFNMEFYNDFCRKLYGSEVGKCIQYSIDSIEGNGGSESINATCLGLTLHGDPAIIIHASMYPDYAVDPTSVYFSPSYVSTDISTFTANVIVTNIGRATDDSVTVELKRIFADGTSVDTSKKIHPLYFRDTVKFIFPVDPLRGPGLNKFEVRVNAAHNPDENNAYANNDLTGNNAVPLLIYSGDVIPVYPYTYAIIPNDYVTLKAYTANPFAKSAQYIFEMDTTDAFNSPIKRTQYVTQAGAVVKADFHKWSPPFSKLDTSVYFWRVRRNDPDLQTYPWRESSFEYLPGKRGWGQSHFFQFTKGDKYKYILPNKPKRYFDLDYSVHSIEVKPINMVDWPYPNCSYMLVDGIQANYCTYVLASIPHVMIAVMDPLTGDAWYNPGGQPFYGSASVGPCNRYEFLTSAAVDQNSLANFLLNVVPAGYKIILYTSGNHNLGDLLGGNSPKTNPGLVQAFQSIGATQFSNIQNNLPYALVGRKGGIVAEAIGINSTDTSVFIKDTLIFKRESGNIYSEIIGPASKWNSLHWRYRAPSPPAQDSIKISVIGIRNNSTADTLIKNILKTSPDIFTLSQQINADTFPYLELRAWVKDSTKRTPDQLTYWRVYYDGVPELSLNPVKHYSFYTSPVQQGDSISMSVAIENIGDYNMDSTWVDFWVLDASRNKISEPSVKIPPLAIDSVFSPQVKFSTLPIPAGLNSLWVESNPFNSQHKPEQYHFNNIGTIPFLENADKINPLLDVTFDGVHIMNGDIVSAKPNVLIKLKDENTFLALNDPSAFNVSLKRPGSNNYDTISFGSNLVFYSAVLPNNSCKINYTPALPDGIYELKVQAKDRSGNKSGSSEYKISFEVINKPTVTNVMNYPNPFSTSTRFVFTLTGSVVPDYFKIQIMTITGKIIRELNKYELGFLHIGRNITDYAWDGKDEFGDQLANGIYLYRLQTQLDGKALEHRDTNADSFFTQGYGKMYLIR